VPPPYRQGDGGESHRRRRFRRLHPEAIMYLMRAGAMRASEQAKQAEASEQAKQAEASELRSKRAEQAGKP